MQARQRAILFAIFAISGFSGLIYESIWTHYLKLFLGHAAYAQTLVLAIFMGGLALGSWLCSRYSGRWKRLFLGYAVAEGIIGLFAIAFHPLFEATTSVSYATVLPSLGSPIAIDLYKWTLATLLILPQTVLLGMTFPLMSSGILRRDPRTPGKTLAMLYFSNSIGGAVGMLASGFVLIRTLGLPATIQLAGIINVLIALAVWQLMKGQEPEPSEIAKGDAASARDSGGWLTLLLVVSLITGASSFIYETGWIRMLSLVLGSSTRAFELMLSAFILGLAFGGLWVRRRIDQLDDPRRFLGWVQIAMGLLAIATLPVYGNTFRVMGWVLGATERTDSGYFLFSLASHGIALFIMFPAAFCAGMTLPLITWALLGAGHGERSIGAVYAWNTIGAIIGVFFAVHVGLPVLGLKNLISLGAAGDMAIGLFILWKLRDARLGVAPQIAAAGCALVVAFVLLFVTLDPYKMASGVYRTGELISDENSKIVYYADGKTATVSVHEEDVVGVTQANIRTNGKPDAALNLGTVGGMTTDEPTMILAAVLPLAMKPDARSVANIGFGSGLTTHTLLGSASLTEVDTIEIEPAMVEGARYFGERVDRAYSDPRSRIHIADAKTFFSSHNKHYDIIISEPSNPWVSGVAGLFSIEFYRLTRSFLNEGGIFVQWLQIYELSPELVATVMKAISASFDDYAVYSAGAADLVILASDRQLPRPSHGVFETPALAESLRWIGIHGAQDLELRRIGDRRVLDNFFRSFEIPANSDYYPLLDQNAERDRFLGKNSNDLVGLTLQPLPVRDMIGGSLVADEWTQIFPTPSFSPSMQVRTAMTLRDYFLGNPQSLAELPPQYAAHVENVDRLFGGCAGLRVANEQETASLYMVLSVASTFLRPAEVDRIWQILEDRPCARSLSRIQRSWFDLLGAVGARNGVEMVRSAKALLEFERQFPPGAVRYIVGAAMLGSLAERDYAAAASLWRAYKERLYGGGDPSMVMRLLAAESDAQASAATR